MYNYFCMKEVCPFFLLAAQKPLASTIITSVEKINRTYYVCIHTQNERVIESFIERLNGVVVKFETTSAPDEVYYEYTPAKVEKS